MVLERFKSLVKHREISESERASLMVDRITNVFWLLVNKPRAFKDGPSWEEISGGELEVLNQEERDYLLEGADGNTCPWIYAHTRENQSFVAIGLGAKRVKFFVNGDRPRLIYETRISVGVWEEGEDREIAWDELERIVSFVEQVPQRRLLNGSGPPQIDGLPGTEV